MPSAATFAAVLQPFSQKKVWFNDHGQNFIVYRITGGAQATDLALPIAPLFKADSDNVPDLWFPAGGTKIDNANGVVNISVPVTLTAGQTLDIRIYGRGGV